MRIEFGPITVDPSIFINKWGLIIALYVDDIVIFGKDQSEIDVVKRKLERFHSMTDAGLVKKLLGICFNRKKDGSICLDQESYARQVLEEFGMADCNPASVPISPSVKLNSDDSPRLVGEYVICTANSQKDICQIRGVYCFKPMKGQEEQSGVSCVNETVLRRTSLCKSTEHVRMILLQNCR